MSQMPHGLGHQTLTDRSLRGLIGTVDDMIVSQQAEFRSDGQRLSSFRSILPPGVTTGFTGAAGMTFTITNDGLVTYRYLMITQELMFVDVWVVGTTGGTASGALLLPLPIGYQVAGTRSRVPCQLLNVTSQIGMFVLEPGSYFISAFKLDATAFALAQTYVIGQVLVNVTPLS